MKTYLVTMTKRLTERQLLELTTLAEDHADESLEEWFSSLVDEEVSDQVTMESWPDDAETNQDVMAKFYTNVNIKEEK